MLEGLEISIINYSELNFERRFDPEYFQKENLRLNAIIQAKPNAKVGDFAFVTDGIHTSIDYCEESNINLISAASPQQNTFNLSRQVFISEVAHAKNPRTALKLNDVIISTVGTIGNCAVVDESILPANSDRHVGIVRINKDVSPYYLSTFLLTKYGRFQTLRESTGNVQLNLFIYKIGLLQVPSLSRDFQLLIEGTVKNGHQRIEQSKTSYAQAEQTLLEAVGLADFKPSTQNTNIKTFAQSFGTSGRLDAEYYQPKYEAFESTVKSNKYGYTFIKNEYDHFNDVSRKLKSAYHYIEISDVNVSDGTNSPILIETTELPANAKFEVKKGDLIISKVRPNRGAITVIEEEFDNLIVSGAFTVLREKPSSVFTKEVLKVLLRTPVYREWMLQFNVGTQYPVIRDEDILNLPIPKIDFTTQTNISQLVQQSFSLKAQSEHLLNVAKRAVEMAIEQDETAAMAFITNS